MTYNGPMTGRILPGDRPLIDRVTHADYGGGFTPQEPAVPFDSGWRAPEPASTSSLFGNGKGAAPLQMGLAADAEGHVARQLAATPESSERNLLSAEWAEVNRRVREFLVAAREQRVADLRARLEDVLAQGRVALDRWKQCDTEERDAQSRINAHLDPLSKARLALRQVEAERPNADEWPTAEELKRYADRLSRAQEKANRAERHHLKLAEDVARAKARAQSAQASLQALRDQRDDLQAKIDGRPSRGPFGLIVPGGEV